MRNRYIDTIYQLKNIKRFSNRSVLSSHSPCEHAYYVAQLALYIAKHENLKLKQEDKYDIGVLLDKALNHDVPESITGDVLAPIKHFDKVMHQKIQEIEEIVTKNYLIKYLPTELQNSFYSSIIGCKEGREGALVAICDQLEVLYYLVEERKLGNQQEWVEEVFIHVAKVVETMSKNINTAIKLYNHIFQEYGVYTKNKCTNAVSS